MPKKIVTLPSAREPFLVRFKHFKGWEVCRIYRGMVEVQDTYGVQGESPDWIPVKDSIFRRAEVAAYASITPSEIPDFLKASSLREKG